MKNPSRQERRARKEIKNARALDALADDVMGFVGPGNVTYDVGDGANPVEVLWTRIVHFNVSLQQNSYRPLLAQGLLGGRDRFWPSDGNGSHHTRKQHGIANRDNDKGVGGNRDRRSLGRGVIFVG
jgi:hypothetical protein